MLERNAFRVANRKKRIPQFLLDSGMDESRALVRAKLSAQSEMLGPLSKKISKGKRLRRLSVPPWPRMTTQDLTPIREWQMRPRGASRSLWEQLAPEIMAEILYR